MFSLIKQVFIVLLSSSESLTTKCLPLSDEPFMSRPTLPDLNPVEFKYCPFMISLDKCTPKICVPKETKDINVKAFIMIKNKAAVKTMTKHIPWDCKCKFNIITCNSNQKWNKKHDNVNVKIIIIAKKVIFGILAHVFLRNVSI